MTLRLSVPPLELWGGIECTVNRVGDLYFDQLMRNGHATRIGDLDLFAGLGLRTLRYPVLWERTSPGPPEQANWSWADVRLAHLQRLDIRPIIGLVHHGSGPHYTSLIDPAFAEGLARYAAAFAARYPYLDRYTPVNEPLTTARFSGLYGHWYPHGRDDLTWVRALLIQCRAVVLSMQAIRAINPDAQLVQTEDLGKVFSTPRLAYQAEFENERRWLSLDLLCGRVNRAHALYGYLRWVGIDEAELNWFLEHPCPPDLIGINYYLTSERFLDERRERYPAHTHGGNGQDTYADIEAVRVRAAGLAGVGSLIEEAWERFGLPLAVTEAHLGCTREEQLRWLMEVWEAARAQRDRGADVRAVTVWSLLGAYDWNSLLTRTEGHYESGVFDLRGPEPRPTALARMVRDLAAGQEPGHPVLGSLGWWQRPKRLLYSPVSPEPEALLPRLRRCARPLLITGATGTLGSAFARLCEGRGLPHHLLTRTQMDIADPQAVETVLRELQPWAVINAAGYVRVDDAEHQVQVCHRENANGPALLAAACARHNVALLTFSSDLVFDGSGVTPYVESATVAPLNVYGRSKAEAEERVLQALPSALIVRTSAFFGPWDEYNFVTVALRTMAAGQTLVAAGDMVVSPTYIPDLIHASLDLLIDGEAGLWHLANLGATTWADFAQLTANLAGIDSRIDVRSTQSLGLSATRPRYSALGSERATLLPSLENALGRYLSERRGVPV
ncbi:MAG: sugar nucleotide-binding protein [Gemmatimonadaceae bacterium]|nr:sugar nucleotide-binding protein [Gloeobacterales cyanobacterium ES-bin-141]